jgi:hypothetical protein
LRDLFSEYPFPGKDLVWLVDEIVRIVQHTGSIVLEFLRDDSGAPHGLVCRSPAAPHDECLLPVPRVGVFRSILARVGVMCSQETGTGFDPYHGRYVLTRSSRDGAVRLDVDIENTPGQQRLRIDRVPVPAQKAVPLGNGTPVADHPQQPAV